MYYFFEALLLEIGLVESNKCDKKLPNLNGGRFTTFPLNSCVSIIVFDLPYPPSRWSRPLRSNLYQYLAVYLYFQVPVVLVTVLQKFNSIVTNLV